VLDSLVALAKTILVVILTGATILASFYLGYILIVLLILGSVGVIAYIFFSWDSGSKNDTDWFDFKN